MSILRTNVTACIPDLDSMSHEFVESRAEEVVVPFFDKNGNKVREVNEKKILRTPIPDEVWENRGISAESFNLENQINAGVQLKPFTGSFVGVDLDESDNLGSEFIENVNNFMAKNATIKIENVNNSMAKNATTKKVE